MKITVIFLLFIVLSAGLVEASAQGRRPAPPASAGKANKRPDPQPSPPAENADVPEADAADVIAIDTRLVTIPVRVVDRSNRFVAGLGRDNFQVFENGVQQPIEHFSNEAQPFTVALMLDMSYSTVFKIGEIQSAALAFIDRLRPEDRVTVISFDEEVHVLCEPTSDRKRIERAIMSTKISTGTSLYEAVGLAMNEKLRGIQGRKAIVLFTDGVDTTSDRSGYVNNLSDALEIDALIYPIRYDTFADVQRMKNQPISTLPGQRPARTPPTVPSGRTSPFPFPEGAPAPGMPSDRGTTEREYAEAERYLDQLAQRTGGTVYLADSLGNLNRAFTRIASELREFYSLGYYPSDDAAPGQVRRLKVRTDRDGVAVRARDSYVVPSK